MSAEAPEAGEVLWVDFGELFGPGQAGRRPALVLSPRAYNANSSLLIVCPITRSERPWPFKVPMPSVGRVSGFVVVDQIRAIDRAQRAIKSVGAAPAETLAQVYGRLAALFGLRLAA